VGHVEYMRLLTYAYKILSEILMGREHSEDLDIAGNIILEWMEVLD